MKAKAKRKPRPLKRCQADQDGECCHPQCVQIRDGEPDKTDRFCPLPPGNPIVALRESGY